MISLALWTGLYCLCIFHGDLSSMPLVKKIKYDISLLCVKATSTWTGEAWWNHINPTAHYLGAQPQANWDHKRQIACLNVDSILMIIEEFEEEGGWLHQPVQVNEWTGPFTGLSVYAVRASDFSPMRFVELDEALQWMREQDEQGRRIYVHCKAGRGRSASVFWAYLILVHNMEPDEALASLMRQRPSVNIGRAQRQVVLDYVRYIKCRADPSCFAVHDERYIMMSRDE
jgi:atypical dual specificity phosphatase